MRSAGFFCAAIPFLPVLKAPTMACKMYSNYTIMFLLIILKQSINLKTTIDPREPPLLQMRLIMNVKAKLLDRYQLWSGKLIVTHNLPIYFPSQQTSPTPSTLPLHSVANHIPIASRTRITVIRPSTHSRSIINILPTNDPPGTVFRTCASSQGKTYSRIRSIAVSMSGTIF